MYLQWIFKWFYWLNIVAVHAHTKIVVGFSAFYRSWYAAFSFCFIIIYTSTLYGDFNFLPPTLGGRIWISIKYNINVTLRGNNIWYHGFLPYALVFATSYPSYPYVLPIFVVFPLFRCLSPLYSTEIRLVVLRYWLFKIKGRRLLGGGWKMFSMQYTFWDD